MAWLTLAYWWTRNYCICLCGWRCTCLCLSALGVFIMSTRVIKEEKLLAAWIIRTRNGHLSSNIIGPQLHHLFSVTVNIGLSLSLSRSLARSLYLVPDTVEAKINPCLCPLIMWFRHSIHHAPIDAQLAWTYSLFAILCLLIPCLSHLLLAGLGGSIFQDAAD